MNVEEPPSTILPAPRIGVSEILKIGAVAQRLKQEGWSVVVPGAGERDS